MQKQRPGVIRDAILQAFDASSDGMLSVKQIESLASDFLGEAPAGSSVRSYLNLNTPTLFERAGRGLYRLQPAPESAAPSTSTPYFSRGKTQLFLSDSFEWLASREPNSIQGVVTDPPYGVVEYTRHEQAKLRSGKGGVWRIPPSFDGHQRSPLPRFTTLTGSDLDRLELFFRDFGELIEKVLVPGGHLLLASNPLLSHYVARALQLSGLERRGEVIRLVQTMRGGDRPKNAHDEFPEVSVMPRSMWEPWLLFRKPLEGTVAENLRQWKTGGLRRISDEQPFGDVIKSSPTRAKERALAPHPSLKPQALMRQLVRAILPLGEGIVLDPFAGSGSTLAAAEAIGYSSIGVEFDPEYAKLASNSIHKLSSLPDH